MKRSTGNLPQILPETVRSNEVKKNSGAVLAAAISMVEKRHLKNALPASSPLDILSYCAKIGKRKQERNEKS